MESDKLASGSSGKGGGLIARWAEPECLALPSFSLHEELAHLHDGAQRWGYRRATCADCLISTTRVPSTNKTGTWNDGLTDSASYGIPECLDWIDRKSIISYDTVGTESDTAQCDPLSFTNFLFDEACKMGVEYIHGTALQIEPYDGLEARVAVWFTTSTHATPELLIATDVVVATGPWSSTLLPEAPGSGARCHSLVLRPESPLSNNLLFLDITYMSEHEQRRLTPEIYPRADGTVYACEASDPTHALPLSSAEVTIDARACERIYTAVGAVSPPLKNAEVLREQVCYQPIVTFEGQRRKLVGPYLGHTSIPSAYIATGHDSWGISNAPATGKAMSELIYGGKSTSIDIESLSIENVLSRAKG